MANEQAVRQYLAYWFQAGKRLVMKGGRDSYAPRLVFQGNNYSPDFESCWEYLTSSASGECYLEGTEQSIQELLSNRWEVLLCARCDMPIPMVVAGVMPAECPCTDLPTWPNNDIPKPHSPINTTAHLTHIRNRLMRQESDRPLADSDTRRLEIDKTVIE